MENKQNSKLNVKFSILYGLKNKIISIWIYLKQETKRKYKKKKIMETTLRPIILDNSQKDLKLGAKSNLLVLIIALVSIAQTILQFMFFNYSRNYIYFISTFLLGPLQFSAIVLVFCISEYLLNQYIHSAILFQKCKSTIYYHIIE